MELAKMAIRVFQVSLFGLFSTYFRFMELAGTGSSQANLTAEPAEAVDWCSKQSRAMGWALPFIGGAGRGRGGAA